MIWTPCGSLPTLRAALESDICGQSGLGKSHLAATWLKELYAQGWDVGWIDDLDKSKIKDWRPRAHTAIVLDRLDRLPVTQEEWRFLASIDEAAKTSKYRVRIIILAYSPVALPNDIELPVKHCLNNSLYTDSHGAMRAAHQLWPVDTAFVHAYRRALGMHDLTQEAAQQIVSEFEGLTIYVAMKARDPKGNPRELIVHRADAALERAENFGGFASLIAMSAIAGPCRLQRRGVAAWKEPYDEIRQTVFAWERPRRNVWAVRLRKSNEFEIPAYVPQAEGDEVLLAYLGQLHLANSDGTFDQYEADAFLERATTVGGQQVIDRIVALLNVHPLVEDAWQRKNPAFQTRLQEYEKGSDRQTRIAAILTLDACLLRHRRDANSSRLGAECRVFCGICEWQTYYSAGAARTKMARFH